jgi:carboxyl-terminal processing protease
MKIAVTASIALGLLAGMLWPLQGSLVQASSSQELARLMRVSAAIQRYSLTPVTEAALLEAASAGLVNALEDPYSLFLNSSQYQALQAQKTGEVVGIGVELAYREQQAVVVSVLPDTPAQRAGLQSGDRLLAVDGVDLAKLSWAEINTRLQGKKGEILLLRWQSLTPARQRVVREARLQRADLLLTATTFTPKGEGLCTLKVHTFFKETLAEDIAQLLQQEEENCINGLVLDLRNNPGGLVGQAVDLAATLGVAGTVFQLQSREGGITPINAPSPVFTWTLPLVVLVDKSSASAAELLAAALKESGRAVIMGETTFGKGLVQSLFSLPNETGLSLTTARYLTRLGNTIHKRGLAPDVVIQENGPTEGADVAEEIALDYLR